MLPVSIYIGLAGTAALMADVGAGYANLQAEMAE